MVPSDILASPLVWFAVMVLAGWALFLWSSKVAPPFRAIGQKAKAYTGGEAIPGQVYRPGYEFFHVAFFFTIMHVAAIVVAPAPPGGAPWAAAGDVGAPGLAVGVLRG